ncbi:hypothetical protein EYC59_05665 [Candidatus Saccharibacteria bacterium]|nr:MAG: hypothetical protein EYC59_05665 [Candidatus Saccharibacteria bacterium]
MRKPYKVTLVVLLVVLALGVVALKTGYIGETRLRANLTGHFKADFKDVNVRLQKDYGIDFAKSGTDLSCYNSEDAFGGPVDTCGKYGGLVAVTADAAFIANWHKTSPALETWLLQNGWKKDWNAAQPIAEILDRPLNDGSIGVNYIKKHGKTTCRLSLTWVQPDVPNQLSASEECIGTVRD